MDTQLFDDIQQIASTARTASRSLTALPGGVKNTALLKIADLLNSERDAIKEENSKDLKAGELKGLSAAMMDRLTLSDDVIDSMIGGIHEVCALADPVGTIEQMALRPNGLRVGRMRVPLGVIGMIYESRPNVTVDAAALCLKTGNSIILRGGSEAIHSNLALGEILKKGLADSSISPDCVQVIPVTDRDAIKCLLEQEELIDLIIPRGGEGLIRYVSQNSRIPVLKHYKGVCHIYVDCDADLDKAYPIVLNSKTHRPGVCNALEGLLVHGDVADTFIPEMVKRLVDAGVDVRGCDRSTALSAACRSASEEDWGEEFLDLAMVLKVVDSMTEAQQYIACYGSNHTESIITENHSTAMQFLAEVDASAVMVNASTRFNDGGQLGLGTEIGISTTKLHAYGPMGLEELTARKFIVLGSGQVRE